jgi:hypothetical protein
MLRVKGQDGYLPIGPALVTRDEWTPDDGYTLRTYLNGALVQSGDQDDIIWDYRYQLADLSRLITLEPGDVVLTGTPAKSRPMQPGDTVEVEIVGLPRLSNTVVDWDVDLSGPGEQIQVSANTLHVALAIPEAEAEERCAGRSTVIALRIDHVCLRVADSARRWSSSGSAAASGARPRLPRLWLRALLELWTSRGDPGHDHSAFELRELARQRRTSTRSASRIGARRTTTGPG